MSPPPRFVISHHVQRWHRLLVPARDGRVELLHRGTGARRSVAETLWGALERALETPSTQAAVLQKCLQSGLSRDHAEGEWASLVADRFIVEPAHDYWDDFQPALATEPQAGPAALARDRLRWSRDVIAPHGLWMYPQWLGVRTLQWPPDLWLMQELLHAVRPAFLIETGLFEGGGALFYASMFELLGQGHVVAVEKHLRPDVVRTLAAHPLARRITILEGDSADPEIVERVSQIVGGPGEHLLALDSDHSEKHVLSELEAYSPLVIGQGRAVVFDTSMSLVATFAASNPHGAVRRFLAAHPEWRLSSWAGASFTTTFEDGVLERYPER